jgi:hypothetical protein
MHIRLSEPSLKNILSEPIVIDLMDADRVDRAEFLTMVREIAADLTSRSRGGNIDMATFAQILQGQTPSI